MKRALTLAAAILAMGLSAPVLSTPQTQSVQSADATINALVQEWARLHGAGQHDAALIAVRKALQLAEAVVGSDPERIGTLRTFAGSTLLAKGDRPAAEAEYKFALAILELKYGQRLPGWSCYIPALLASMITNPLQMDGKIAYYERAVACYEATPKPGAAGAVEAVYQLSYYYRYRRERPDLVAKAAPLLDRWIPIAARDLGADRYEVARLMRGRGEIYAAQGDMANARAIRLRALAILSSGPGPAKGGRAKLKEEGSLLLSLMDMYRGDRGSNIDETYVDYQARYLAVLEQTEGSASSLTISARRQLADLQAQFPDWQPPGSRTASPAPVRQASVPSSAPAGPRGISIVQAPPGKGKPTWPTGMESGNIFFVINNDRLSDAFPIMVAATNAAEATSRVERANAKSLEGTISAGRINRYRVVEGGECAGPIWGALVINHVDGRWVWGGGCGKTPAAAIEAAFAACEKNASVGCEKLGAEYWQAPGISLALSGSTSWSGEFCGTCFPTVLERFGSFNAFTVNTFLNASFILGMKDAISKLGKVCDPAYPCFYTSTRLKCHAETDASTRAQKCTDARLKPDGYDGPIR